MESLINAGCIFTESLKIQNITQDDLVSISPSGHVHLNLLANLDYLTSCSEDVWYRDERLAETIAKRMAGLIGSGLYSFKTVLGNASDLVNYMSKYKKYFYGVPQAFLDEKNMKITLT